MKENEEIKEAIVEVHKMSEDEKIQRLADLREKAIMDEKSIYRTGLHKGEKKGIKEGKLAIAEKLLRKDMNVDEIAEITGLGTEEIKKIKL